MKYLLVISIFILTSCVSSLTKDFCVNSGFKLDTPEHNGCVDRNQRKSWSNKMFFDDIFKYCNKHYNITKEGAGATRCFSEAVNMKKQYNADYQSCKTIAKTRYPRSITLKSGEVVKIKTCDRHKGRKRVGLACMKQKGWNIYQKNAWNLQKKHANQ